MKATIAVLRVLVLYNHAVVIGVKMGDQEETTHALKEGDTVTIEAPIDLTAMSVKDSDDE